MYYVYVIKSSSTAKTYIGHTQDLESRLHQHNNHRSSPRGGDGDWKLIYVEAFTTRALAMKREQYFKTGDGRRVLQLKKVLATADC